MWYILCTHREETTSLVISAQISADSQRKTELGSKPVLLTFNIGPVCGIEPSCLCAVCMYVAGK